LRICSAATRLFPHRPAKGAGGRQAEGTHVRRDHRFDHHRGARRHRRSCRQRCPRAEFGPGSLRTRALEPAERERYEERWAAVQERFVDSPREAATEAHQLLGEVAASRGFPDGGRYEDQIDALSVHHPHRVNGFRRLHGAAAGTATEGGTAAEGTEELRESMVEARELFRELLGGRGRDHGGNGMKAEADRTGERGRTSAGHLPLGFTRRHAKGN
jgi:hypothetical protein